MWQTYKNYFIIMVFKLQKFFKKTSCFYLACTKIQGANVVTLDISPLLGLSIYK